MHLLYIYNSSFNWLSRETNYYHISFSITFLKSFTIHTCFSCLICLVFCFTFFEASLESSYLGGWCDPSLYFSYALISFVAAVVLLCCFCVVLVDGCSANQTINQHQSIKSIFMILCYWIKEFNCFIEWTFISGSIKSGKWSTDNAFKCVITKRWCIKDLDCGKWSLLTLKCSCFQLQVFLPSCYYHLCGSMANPTLIDRAELTLIILEYHAYFVEMNDIYPNSPFFFYLKPLHERIKHGSISVINTHVNSAICTVH